MTPKPKLDRLNVNLDHANRRVFVSWYTGAASGTITLTAEQACAIGDVGKMLLAVQAELDCRSCLTPFDEADKRFDGHARHADTPFCRSCLDVCHEADAGHRCQICVPASKRT